MRNLPSKIYKNLFIIFVLVTLLSASAYAYFTSSVKAQDNEITTGTLLAGIATVDGQGDAYNVAVDNNGVIEGLGTFPEVASLLPGDGRELYVAVFNKGSSAFDFRSALSGQWLSTPRIATTSADPALISLNQVTRVAENDTSVPEVATLKTYLETEGYQWQNGAQAGVLIPDSDNYYLEDQTLEPARFEIYQIHLGLDAQTSNDYQGATYTYDYIVDAKQTNAPDFN